MLYYFPSVILGDDILGDLVVRRCIEEKFGIGYSLINGPRNKYKCLIALKMDIIVFRRHQKVKKDIEGANIV